MSDNLLIQVKSASDPDGVLGHGLPGMVSTVITSYNKGPYLGEAIESALCQDYAPQEIIVVDDGSTDNTREVAAAFGKQVHYVYRPNGGQSSAENHGIRLARGQLIAFLDGDDRWRAGKLRKQIEIFRKNPEVSVVYTRSWIFDHRTGKPPAGSRKRLPLQRGRILDPLLIWNFIPFSSSMVRKDCLIGVGMFDEAVSFPNDLDLWLRIAHKYSFDFVDEELVEYRVGIEQVTSSMNDAYMRTIAIQRRFVQRFYDGQYPRPGVVRRGVAMKYAAHGDMLLGQGKHLKALAAHGRALCLDPWKPSRWSSVVRDLIPNRLAAPLKRSLAWRTALKAPSKWRFLG